MVKNLANRKKTSLSAAPFRAAIFVILTMSGILGLFWAYDEYLSYRFALDSIRQRYLHQYQNRLIEEMESVIDFVEYRRSQTDQLIESELRDKVQTAYTTAAHLYSLYKNEIGQEELKTMIVEAIRPLRWETGKGYYFIGRMADGYLELDANFPELEKASQLGFRDANGAYVFKDMIEIVNQRGAGVYRYLWPKPEVDGRNFPKISIVRSFEPFNWFIGTGIYEDDMQAQVKEEVLSRLRKIHFGKNGSVACFNAEGVTLIDFEEMRSGRKVSTLVDAHGTPFGRQMHATAQGSSNGGFIEYVRHTSGTTEDVARMSFVKTYPAWNWVFVTSIDMDEMEETIQRESSRHLKIVYREVAVFVFLFLLTITFVGIITYFHSLRIKHGISLFTDFFKDAADRKIKFNEDDFRYAEFAALGEVANRMVDEKIEKEHLIQADKIRLDTLLRISTMSEASQKEISDFTLARMLEITRSERGYIAFLNNDRSIVSYQSFLERNGAAWTKNDSEISFFADRAGYPSAVLQKGAAVISNTPEEAAASGVYPAAKGPVHNHIDVPIVDGGDIPLIAGVCNKTGDYGDTDVGQINLLLEGMWHHFLKSTSDREMARLRNLLKGINDSMPSVLIGVDMNGRVMQWNKEAERVTSISARDAEHRLLNQVFPRLTGHLWKIQAVVESGVPSEERNVPYSQDGETRYDTITVYPLVAEHVTGVVIRIDDVTEKVRIEELMIQSEKMLSVGGLAAGMAHEINNPLAGILQNLQVVQNRLSPELRKNSEVAASFGIRMEDVEAYLKARGIDEMFRSINESARRAAQLVLNMLSFSRKSDSSFSTQDICRLMDDALELSANDYDLKKRYDFRRIEIIRSYDGDIPLVACEATNIQQVFLNIVKNAAHALAEKQFADETPRLAIGIRADKRMVTVEIADNGPGMDEKTRKRIFEPFFTTKPVGLGTGLGMSIAYFIIHDQHKGTIQVQSEPGKGATFTVRLPYFRV